MIYERMKNIRTYYDNTQKEIAKQLGVSRSTYAGWENGIDAIPLEKLNSFCNFYKVSLDYICGLSNKQKSNTKNKEIDREQLGKKLRENRIENKDSQSRIANIIQVDQSNYSKYERGKILIHTYPLINYAKHYNISLDYLVGKTLNKKL